jgi:hypothetical protein
MRRLFFVLCLVIPALAFADPLLIESTVGHPVVPELMGGCSMKCAFPWTTEAILPGQHPDPVYTLDDNCKDTAWTDAVVGAKLTFTFPRKLPAELNGTPFYGFDIANGDIQTEDTFKEYGRIRGAGRTSSLTTSWPHRAMSSRCKSWRSIPAPDILPPRSPS